MNGIWTTARANNFFSKQVYRTFFDKYQFFADNPYGFVVVLHTSGRDFYYFDGGYLRLPSPFGVGSILEDAIRAYPVIARDGKLKLVNYKRPQGFGFCWFGQEKKGLHCSSPKYARATGLDDLSIERRDKDVRNLYVCTHNGQGIGHYTFYGVGFNDIPPPLGNEPVKVLGMPMFQQFPYNNLVNTVKKT